MWGPAQVASGRAPSGFAFRRQKEARDFAPRCKQGPIGGVPPPAPHKTPHKWGGTITVFAAGSLLGHDDEISVLARLRTKALIGDEQGGARGNQRNNALKRFRRKFDAVKRVGSGAAQVIRG
jgi:hypothetical protein